MRPSRFPLRLAIFAASLASLNLPLARAADLADTLTFRAETPKTQWDGWGFSGAAATPAPGPAQFHSVPRTGPEPRTFSGKVVGESLSGVEVGLVSLVGVHWVNPKAYQWQPVSPDGTFSITDANFLDDAKSIVVRGPQIPWTFLNHDFAPNEGADQIVLKPDPAKTVHMTVAGATDKALTDFSCEIFPAHTRYDELSKPLRRQRLGMFKSAGQDHLDLVLPLGQVALFVHSPGCAGFYQVLDDTQAANIHFVLQPAGQMKITVLGGDGQPKPNMRVNWSNPAAPLSLGGGPSDANGVLVAQNLVPGAFVVRADGCAEQQVTVTPNNTSEVVLHETGLVRTAQFSPGRTTVLPVFLLFFAGILAFFALVVHSWLF